MKIIQRAGLTPWPKLWHNLRSTRQTELAEKYPEHVVCAWLGNSQAVARRHYLQVTDEHFAKAITEKAAQKAAQQGAETGRTERNANESQLNVTADSKASYESFRDVAGACETVQKGGNGPEWSRTIDLVVISDAL